MRTGRVVLIGVLASVLVIGGVLTWRQFNRAEDQVAAVVASVASGLQRGELAADAFGPDAAAVEELTALMGGLGTLRPVVSPGPVSISPDGTTAQARLGFDWTIHEGKPHWRYDSFLTLRRVEGNWRADWRISLINPELEPGDRLRAVRLPALRGEIVGAEGVRLFWNDEAQQVGVDKTRLAEAEWAAAATSLARLLGIDPARYRQRVASSGPRGFVVAAVLRTSGEDLVLLRRAVTINGVIGVRVTQPVPLRRDFAESLLGNVGEATAEIIGRSGGAIRPGDLVGLSGLQQTRDGTLAGTTGFRVFRYPAENPKAASDLFTVDPRPGRSVEVTLEVGWQQAAEAAADQGAAVVVLNGDGGLLGAAGAVDDVPPERITLSATEAAALENVGRLDPTLGSLIRPPDGRFEPVPAGPSTVKVSPLGVALLGASSATSPVVRPFLVIRERPPGRRLSDADAKAVAAVYQRLQRDPSWAAKRVGEASVVVYAPPGGRSAQSIVDALVATVR